MSFPTITFKHTNVEPQGDLQDRISEKLKTLAQYLHGARALRVEVEIERLPVHQHGPICRIEANLWRGDTLTRAEATALTFEQALDTVRAHLEDELGRAHDKRVSVFRRSARRLKEMMRFGG